MTDEHLRVLSQRADPTVIEPGIEAAANFDRLLLQGLSGDCTPCYESRRTYVKEHAVFLSGRFPDIPTALQRIENDILPCLHPQDNADVGLAVAGLLRLNRSNA